MPVAQDGGGGRQAASGFSARAAAAAAAAVKLCFSRRLAFLAGRLAAAARTSWSGAITSRPL